MTAIAACRKCGTEPREDARFGDGCGSPIKDTDIRAEYKQVTVLFADVVRLRVELHSGQVIAGDIGSGPFGYTAVGERPERN